MSKLFATAGTRLDIGPAMAFDGVDLAASDFTTGTPTWARITGTTNLGSAGDQAELITSGQIDPGNPDNSARTRKLKGSRNAGSMEVVCDLDYSDAGQLALIAAEKTQHSYMFRITFNDAPPGGTPSIRYFIAYVMGASEQFDEVNSVMKLNSTLEIDSNIVRVSAASA